MKNTCVLLLILTMLFSCGKKESKEEQTLEVVKDSVAIEKEAQEILEEDTLPSILFTVQVAALEKPNQALESLVDITTYKENGLTKYRLGNFETYKDAKDFKKMVKKSYPDAFIQALENDKPIHISKALQ